MCLHGQGFPGGAVEQVGVGGGQGPLAEGVAE
jgi:hypothetical protein